MKLFARILALLWGVWWTYFGIVSSLHENLDILGAFLHLTFPGLLFLASALYCLKSEFTGPLILALEGIAVVAVYALIAMGRFPVTTFLFVFFAMALPPMASGSMLLWLKAKKIQQRFLGQPGQQENIQ